MSNLLWPDEAPKKGKRFTPNPIPRIPNLGWKPANDFPDLSGAKIIAVDVETHDPLIKEFGSGWGSGRGHIIGISLATNDGFNKYFPMRHEVGFNHDPQKVIRYVREQLSRPHQPKVAHNAIYDVGYLEHEGMPVVGDVYCTWIAEKLINHSESASLEDAAQRRLGEGKSSDALYRWSWEAFGKGKAKNPSEMRALSMQNLYRTPAELVGFYAESDTALPLQLLPKQWEEMDRLGLLDVYEMECGLVPLLVQMRLAGVSVDLDAAERARDSFLATAHSLQQSVDKIAGSAVNTSSPKEVAKVFDRLKIRYPRTEKTDAPSFKGEFLKTVEHPIGALIVELEEVKKYVSTFIENAILDSHVNGKIYPSFNMLRAVTGRASCSQPNCQQVPSRNALAKTIRSIFIPDNGHDHFRKYDYSSVEARLLGHFAVGSGSSSLRKQYNENPLTDFHSYNQQMIKKLVGLEVDRKKIKVAVFSLIYGSSEAKLARSMGLSAEDASTFFEAFHGGCPYVKATMKKYSDIAEQEGVITTILGRRIRFEHYEPRFTAKGAPRPIALPLTQAIQAFGPNIRRAYLHKASNALIQGSAADLMKMAMLKCWKDGVYAETGVPRMVIHDEKTFSVSEAGKDQAFREMQHIMETAIPFSVPIRVEGEKGSSWGQTEGISD
jgi:DNA polymerase I-like protein with 3'-5' exonuclease and polymerase domains